MKTLITGGAGFIGLHLAKSLVGDGHEVVICDNFSRGANDKELEDLLATKFASVVEVDLQQREELRKLPEDCDTVFHLAAVNGTRNFYERPYEVLSNNLASLLNLLSWAKERSRQRLVWTSSSEVYASTVDSGLAKVPTDEDVPVSIADVSNPRFSYAGSKLAGELLCWHFSIATKIETVIVRPHNVYGPRMGFDHVVPQLIARILNREDPFVLYGSDQTRAFCYVADFVRGLRLAGETPSLETPVLVNIGNDDEIPISTLASMLFDIMDFHPRVEGSPAPPGSTDRRCPDLARAKELLDYQPAIPLKAGLQETVDWYTAYYAQTKATSARA